MPHACCSPNINANVAEACSPAPVKIPTKKDKTDYLNFLAENSFLNEIERYKLYQYLLETAESFRENKYYSFLKNKVVQSEFYFCIAIDDYNRMNYSLIHDRYIFDPVKVDYLPELLFFKPDTVINSKDSWFDYDEDPEALEKRIFILECCVILTAPI